MSWKMKRSHKQYGSVKEKKTVAKGKENAATWGENCAIRHKGTKGDLIKKRGLFLGKLDA